MNTETLESTGLVSRGIRPGAALVIIAILAVSITLSGCKGGEITQPEETWAYADPGTDGTADRFAAGHGDFRIEVRYDSISSDPAGGGIFSMRLNPGEDFSGAVGLDFEADARLSVHLSRHAVNPRYPVVEIIVKPRQSISPGLYTITVMATNSDFRRKLRLTVNVINWMSSGGAHAAPKQKPFASWLETNHPELGDFSHREWSVYATYPGILVVEHWTYLDAEWEMRICFHVMIPPYDWSKMWLRKRGEWEPTLAAMRETDGTIHEIPVADYPIMGY
jgi:hypothetical protein